MKLLDSYFRGEKYGQIVRLMENTKHLKSSVFNGCMSIEKSCDVIWGLIHNHEISRKDFDANIKQELENITYHTGFLRGVSE